MDSAELDAFVEDVDDSISYEGTEPAAAVEAPAVETPTEPTPAEPEAPTEAKPDEVAAESSTEPEVEPQDFDPDDPAEKTPEARIGLRRSFAERQQKWREQEQTLREENARLRGQSEVHQSLARPTPEQQPDVNPDDQFYELGPTAWAEQRDQAQAKADQLGRIQQSAIAMRSVHEDFDELSGEFMELVQADPSLEARAVSSDSPAKFAYDYAKMARETKDMGSPQEYRAKVRAELKEEMLAESREKKAQAAAAQTTTSSAGASGASADVAAVGEVDDMDYGDMLKGVNNTF